MTHPHPVTVSAVSHVDALPVGTRLAEFEILSLLGVGGFGMVYQAFDHSLHRTVAIKEYMPSALAGRAQGQSLWVRSPGDGPAFAAGLKSFVGEARLLAQFDHPSLVKVFRFWEEHNTAYMVMPLYSGMTLKQARAQMRTPPSEAWLRRVLWSVLGALQTLHEGHTLHRDISPDNIFLQDIGPPVLLDLGAARRAIHDSDRNHTAILKIHYAPIEQYAGGSPDVPQGPWSDLYSLAAVVYGCLCNDAPQPSTLRAVHDAMTPLDVVARTVEQQFGQTYSPTFVMALAQALALRPQQRPQSIEAFLQAMDMTSPPAVLDHFDFRAELGDIWVEPADQPGPGLVVPTVDLHPTLVVPSVSAQEQTPTLELELEPLVPVAAVPSPAVPAQTSALPAAPPQPARPMPIPEPAEPHSAKKPVWALGAAALLLVAVGAGYSWSQRKPLRAGHDDIITELAERPAPVAAASAASEAAATALAAASSPASVAAVASEPAGPPPAFVVAPVQAPASVASAPGLRPGAVRRNVRAAAPSETVLPSAAPANDTRPPEPASAAPAPPPLPLCFNSNFFTRSACLYRECAKPVHAALPVCVEHHQRLQQEAERKISH